MLNDETREAISAEIARILSEERKKAGVSMNRLAEKTGLSQSLVSSFESNPWNPTLDTLLRLSSALDLDFAEVVRTATVTVMNRSKR